MAEQRKRLSKKASKILFEIICEDSFEGKSIKTLLPATRRISKAREGLWEYIRSELARRSDEEYDLGTVSAAWYYNLRKIGSCLDQIDLTADDGVTIEKLRTMERYVCNNLGDRIRGRGRGKGRREEESDVKLTETQKLNLSRQTTMAASVNYSFHNEVTAQISRAVTLSSLPVKNERESSSEKNDGNASIDGDEREESMEDVDMREDERMENDLYDPRDLDDAPTIESNHGTGLETPPGDDEVPMDGTPLPSRYNTADTTLISRNNSTMSVSGYDADNEKGLIKRRRKELKKRVEREKEVKVEEKEDEEKKEEEEEGNEKVNDELDEEDNEDEMEDEEKEGEEFNQKTKMIDNLKGMIDNLRDHIVSLRAMGSIDAVDMEALADSFENASKSIIINLNSE